MKTLKDISFFTKKYYKIGYEIYEIIDKFERHKSEKNRKILLDLFYEKKYNYQCYLNNNVQSIEIYKLEWAEMVEEKYKEMFYLSKDIN